MRAVVFQGPGKADLAELPMPEPGYDEVRIRVEAAGMCQTDSHIFRGHFAVKPPRVLGHELAGTVEAVGPGVDTRWIGQRVGVQPARFCGVCRACRSGHEEVCVNFECLGNTHDGGYAEYTVARAEQLVELGDLRVSEAVWLEPLACVFQALSRAPAGELPVLLAGAGTFGRLFTQVLTRVFGCGVGVVDPNPERLAQVRQLGAKHVWTVPRTGPTRDIDDALAAWPNGGPELLIDTTGKAESIERLVRWAGLRGTVLLFGVSAVDERLAISPAELFRREITLTASGGMTRPAFEKAVGAMREGVLALDAMIAGTISLEAVPEKLRDMPSGKLIITPHQPA